MHPSRFTARRWVVAAACIADTAAFADCTPRATRPAETAFNARAMAALVSALPPVPAGVVEVDAKAYDFRNAPAIHEVLCEGSKEGDFSITARRKYVRKHSEPERRQLEAQYDTVTAQFHALRKTPADKAAEQQLLRQQSNAAWQATRNAEKAGDKAAAQASDAQYRTLRDRADAIDAQHEASVKPQLQQLDQRRTAIDLVSQRVDIVLSMNLPRLPSASAGDAGVVEAFGTASPAKSVGLKVHNVVVSVRGSDGPLRQSLARATDRVRLQAMVGKPLPSEAESEAVAGRATPPVVPEMVTVAGGAAAAVADPSATAAAAATAATAPNSINTTTNGTSNTASAAEASPRAPPPAERKPVDTAAADPVKKAVDAVNQLRGLLGR